jgi:hypothetical protein
MAESIRKVQYLYVMAPDKPGEGARALQTLRDAGVNLLAFSGFPAGKRAQLDFIPEDPAAFRAVARKAIKATGPGWGSGRGDDRIGVMADLGAKLAAADQHHRERRGHRRRGSVRRDPLGQGPRREPDRQGSRLLLTVNLMTLDLAGIRIGPARSAS